jgi:uncharacterized membrane protein YeaQ/YmgE (transglycosylase-associated protein family)
MRAFDRGLCNTNHCRKVTAMGIISWIVFGLIAGALAKWIMPGKDPAGCIVTIVIGVVGAFLGGYVGTLLKMGTVDGFDIRSFFLAVVGGVLLLAIYRLVIQKKGP